MVVLAVAAWLALTGIIFAVLSIEGQGARLVHLADRIRAMQKSAVPKPAPPPSPTTTPTIPRFPGAAADERRALPPNRDVLGNPGNWFLADDYPVDAQRRNEAGRVVIRLKIDPQGVPRACAIVSSSGSISLDNASCDLALRRGRFKPVRGPGGIPVWSSWISPGIRWTLQDD